MSYINSTLFFEPIATKTKYGDKRIMFKAKSKSGGAKAELFAIMLDNLTAREEKTLMKYFKKIGFSCSVHIRRRKPSSRKNTYGSRKPKPRIVKTRSKTTSSKKYHKIGEIIPMGYFTNMKDAYHYFGPNKGQRLRFEKGDDLRIRKNLLNRKPL